MQIFLAQQNVMKYILLLPRIHIFKREHVKLWLNFTKYLNLLGLHLIYRNKKHKRKGLQKATFSSNSLQKQHWITNFDKSSSTCLLSAKKEQHTVFGGKMIYFDLYTYTQNLATASHSVTVALIFAHL